MKMKLWLKLQETRFCYNNDKKVIFSHTDKNSMQQFMVVAVQSSSVARGPVRAPGHNVPLIHL